MKRKLSGLARYTQFGKFITFILIFDNERADKKSLTLLDHKKLNRIPNVLLF